MHFTSPTFPKELISDLKAFDLEESEVFIYLGLLRSGPITVGNIAVKLGIDRGKVYRSLGKLRNAGLVTTSFSNPAICAPQEPSIALQTLIDKKQDDLFIMQKLAEKISHAMSEIKTKYKKDAESYFSIIQSRPVIYSRIGRMLQYSRDSTIYIVTTGIDLTRMYHTSIPEKIHCAAKNNVIVQILTEPIVSTEILSTIKKLGANEIGTIELPSRGRIIVQKDNQLIMSKISNPALNLSNAEDVAIHTNSTEIVKNIWALCEHLWASSRRSKHALTTQMSNKRSK